MTWSSGAPLGTRTPNPLILVGGFATTLNNASTAALTSMYSSRSTKPACRRFASLLIQRWGLKCGSRSLADTYVSTLVAPRRIAGLGMIAWWGSPDRLTDVLAWLAFAVVLSVGVWAGIRRLHRALGRPIRQIARVAASIGAILERLIDTQHLLRAPIWCSGGLDTPTEGSNVGSEYANVWSTLHPSPLDYVGELLHSNRFQSSLE
jgi:hypothetical protein